jgi:putative thioredoxin
MSQQPFSTAALRGAVDLGAIAAASQRRAAAAEGDGTTGGGAFVVEVTEADFASVVMDQSMTVPVVVDLWTARAAQSQQTSAVLDTLAVEYAGRFLLARVDIDTNPALAQAFQVQTLPFVVAVIKGQPVPLVLDVLPEAAMRQVLDKLLELAAQNGVTGRVTGTADTPGDAAAAGTPGGGPAAGGGLTADGTPAPGAVEPALPPLPPLHQAAYDAIERDDLAAAAEAYEQALRESPADEMAATGLVNVHLMQRTAGMEPAAAVAAGDADPSDTDAQLRAADAEFVEGRVDAAFDRLVEAVRRRSGDEREQVRQRLVDLFSLLEPDDAHVRRARTALTNALF